MSGIPPVSCSSRSPGNAEKHAILGPLGPHIDAGLAYELELWARLLGMEGQKEGMRAFLEKRPPPPPGSRRDSEVASKGFPWARDATRPSKGMRNKDEPSRRD